MGNKESSEYERRKRDANVQVALEKTLEKQRQLYEQRCRQMLAAQAQVLCQENTVSPRGRTEASPGTLNHTTLYPNLQPTASTSGFVVVNLPPDINKARHSENTVPIVANAANVHLVDNAIRRPAPELSAPSETSSQPRKANRPQKNRKNIGGNEINCPTCGNEMGIYIFQCASGHSSCSECRSKGSICGISNCGNVITDMRNRTLEAWVADLNLAAQKSQGTSGVQRSQQKSGANRQTANILDRQHVTNCPNKSDGCNLRFNNIEMEKHLKECPFNEMACPLAAVFRHCSWRGKINHLDRHFSECHPGHRQANVNTEMTVLNIKNDNRIVYLVLMGSYNFLIHLKIDTNAKMMYMAVQLIGTSVSAAKWQYEFHVYNKAQPRRKYQYHGVCLSNNTPIEDVFTNMNCAVIPTEYAMTFEHNSCLNYKFFLKKYI